MATNADYERIGNYACMYNGDKNIDRRVTHRKVPLEVLCLGYARTGTLTMQKAMQILGYPNPYHWSDVLSNVRDSDLWMEAIEARFYGKGHIPDRAFFDSLLGHVGAVSDAPCNLFARELIEAYPEAKVVLVERDIDSWYSSWMTFCGSAYNPVLFLLGRLDPFWFGRVTRLGGAATVIQAGFSETVEQARVRSKDAFRRHYQDVKAMTPPGRLLTMNLKDGWKPLCEFLGKEAPDVKFPHENDTKRNTQAFNELAQMALKHVVKNAIIGLTMVAVLIGALSYYTR